MVANLTAIGNGLSTAFGNDAGLRCGMGRSLSETIRDNVRSLLGIPEGASGVNALIKRGVSNGNAQRVFEGKDFLVSRVQQLAEKLDVQPWELLVPGISRARRPQLLDEGTRPEWPFISFAPDRLDDLDQREIGMIEHAARVELERIEADRKRRAPLAPLDPPANDSSATIRKNRPE